MKFLSPLLALAAVAPTPTSGRLTNTQGRRQTQSSTTNNNDPRSVERKALAQEVDLLGSLPIHVNTERHLRNKNHNATTLMDG